MIKRATNGTFRAGRPLCLPPWLQVVVFRALGETSVRDEYRCTPDIFRGSAGPTEGQREYGFLTVGNIPHQFMGYADGVKLR